MLVLVAKMVLFFQGRNTVTEQCSGQRFVVTFSPHITSDQATLYFQGIDKVTVIESMGPRVLISVVSDRLDQFVEELLEGENVEVVAPYPDQSLVPDDEDEDGDELPDTMCFDPLTYPE